jgi:hypothetical protein
MGVIGPHLRFLSRAFQAHATLAGHKWRAFLSFFFGCYFGGFSPFTQVLVAHLFLPIRSVNAQVHHELPRRHSRSLRDVDRVDASACVSSFCWNYETYIHQEEGK